MFLYTFVSIIKIQLKKPEEMSNLDFCYPDRLLVAILKQNQERPDKIGMVGWPILTMVTKMVTAWSAVWECFRAPLLLLPE